MKVSINGEPKDVNDKLTVLGLLKNLNLNPAVTIVEKNEAIINRENFDIELIQPDDVLELIRFMGGG